MSHSGNENCAPETGKRENNKTTRFFPEEPTRSSKTPARKPRCCGALLARHREANELSQREADANDVVTNQNNGRGMHFWVSLNGRTGLRSFPRPRIPFVFGVAVAVSLTRKRSTVLLARQAALSAEPIFVTAQTRRQKHNTVDYILYFLFPLSRAARVSAPKKRRLGCCCVRCCWYCVFL